MPNPFLSLVLAAVLAGPLRAEPLPCPDPRFEVDADDPDLAMQLCDLAAEAADRLSACGLTPTRPLLIEVVESIAHPVADCLAAYDCDFDRIRISHPDGFDGLLPAGSPYSELPTDVLLGALLTHELSHAFLHQTAMQREITPVDHEYVAAAMELDSLQEEWRQVLLDHSLLEEARPGLIDIWIYRLEPRRFSANAWLHFQAPGNGCALIGRIAEGRHSFASD